MVKSNNNFFYTFSLNIVEMIVIKQINQEKVHHLLLIIYAWQDSRKSYLILILYPFYAISN